MSPGFPVSFVVELTLAFLLVATLFICVKLEGRLRNLRKDQEMLTETVRALNGGIAAAQASLAGLRAAAQQADDALGPKVASARALAEELSLLTEACENIANRIEGTRTSGARKTATIGDSLLVGR